MGHLLADVNGVECPCGAYGHVEAYASRGALIRDARAVAEMFKGAAIKRLANDDLAAITDDTVIAAAREGDEVARDLLDRATLVFGKTMVGVVNLLDPELIVIGGGLGEKWPGYVRATRDAIDREALAGRSDVQVVPAALGNEAGVIGAASLAFDEYDSREESRL